MTDLAVFDHAALALRDREEFWDVFVGALGGQWVGSGDNLGGFSFAQLRFANGLKIEALEPLAFEGNIVDRFVDRSGPGPHHLTFTVPDLSAAVARAVAAGYQPLGVSLEGGEWQEAFIHPRQAAGIVVQLAWSAGDPSDPAPPWLPPPRVAQPAELVHVALAVADLDAALALFKGLLGGRSVNAGAGGGLGFVDLAFAGSGSGQLRLLAGDPVTPWIGGRPGRMHSFCFRLAQPGDVAGAVARDGWWEVPPTPNLGVRLILIEPGAPIPSVAR